VEDVTADPDWLRNNRENGDGGVPVHAAAFPHERDTTLFRRHPVLERSVIVHLRSTAVLGWMVVGG
jgi:hypothetical protein